jgi:ATP-dependent exoDNAse (exonuclease V) beta subunit
MNKTESEGIEFAEERRVFYVALTRTRNQVTLLCNRDANRRSKFLGEIMDMAHAKEEDIYI